MKRNEKKWKEMKRSEENSTRPVGYTQDIHDDLPPPLALHSDTETNKWSEMIRKQNRKETTEWNKQNRWCLVAISMKNHENKKNREKLSKINARKSREMKHRRKLWDEKRSFITFFLSIFYFLGFLNKIIVMKKKKNKKIENKNRLTSRFLDTFILLFISKMVHYFHIDLSLLLSISIDIFQIWFALN